MIRRFVLVVLPLAVAAAGCWSAGPAAPSPLRLSESDPAPAVFAHCRELVCTSADLPRCEFTEIDNSNRASPQSERINCWRASDHVACESLRSALGGATEQRLKFDCFGDPLECEVSGGSAEWARPVQGGAAPRLSCHRPPRPDAPATPALPSPDTA